MAGSVADLINLPADGNIRRVASEDYEGGCSRRIRDFTTNDSNSASTVLTLALVRA